MKVDVKELKVRSIAGIVAGVLLFVFFMIGFAEGFTGAAIYGLEAFDVVAGLAFFVALSVYFFFKGRHFGVEEDKRAYWMLGILFVVCFLFGGLVIALFYGPVQYIIGRFVGDEE